MPISKAAAAAAADDLLARQKQVQDEIRRVMGTSSTADDDTDRPTPVTAPVAPKRKNGQAVSLVELPPIPNKTDTHWDYLLKEMQWYVFCELLLLLLLGLPIFVLLGEAFYERGCPSLVGALLPCWLVTVIIVVVDVSHASYPC